MIRRSLAVASLVLAVAVAASLTGCSRSVPAASLTPTSSATGDVAVTSDVPYRTVGSQSLTVDVCRSRTATGKLPAVLLLHGGGFEQGDKMGMRQLCEQLAEHGAIGVSVQYRLLPDYSFPDQVQDAGAAVRWAKSSAAAKFGIDTAHIGILGSSAGAIIAESVGVGMGGAGSNVQSVVALSGASDFTPAGLKLGKPGPAAEKIVLAYLGCTDITKCATARDASPVVHVSKTSAPMLLLASTNEIVPYQQTDSMAKALQAAKVPVVVRKLPGTAHGLALLNASNLRAIEAYLAKGL